MANQRSKFDPHLNDRIALIREKNARIESRHKVGFFIFLQP